MTLNAKILGQKKLSSNKFTFRLTVRSECLLLAGVLVLLAGGCLSSCQVM